MQAKGYTPPPPLGLRIPLLASRDAAEEKAPTTATVRLARLPF